MKIDRHRLYGMAEIAMPIVVAVVVAWDYFSFSSHINGDGYDYAETY